MYYKKYLKYKQKYLQLKNNYLQVGGGPPLVHNIKNINLFDYDSEMYTFLSPLWGFIWYGTGRINNFYNFYHMSKEEDFIDDISIDDITGLFVNDLFHKNNLEHLLKPTKDCYLYQNIFKPYQIGLLLGLTYFNLKHKDFVDKMSKHDSRNILLKKVKYVNENKCYKNKIKTVMNKIKTLDNTQNLFHVLLTYLWYTSNNKKDFIEYYNGINDAICRFNALFYSVKDNTKISKQHNINYIVIPDNFLDMYTSDDFSIEETDDFELALANTYNNSINFIPVYSQEYVDYTDSNYGKILYPDCGESTLRTFLNILLYNPDTLHFDLEILPKLGAIDNLKEYYEVFYDYSKQSDKDEYNIFKQDLNARNAWSYVVSNLEKVKYKINNKKNDIEYKYEIKSGLSEDNSTLNFLQVIKSLLTNITDWDNLVEIYNKSIPDYEIQIEPNISESGTGTINLNHNINGTYIIKLMQGHFYVDSIESSDDYIKYNSEDKEKQKIILCMKQNVEISQITEDNFMYVKYDNDLFTNVFNNINFSDKNYRLLCNYIIKNYKSDIEKLWRFEIDISRIKTELYKKELYYLNKVNKNYIKFDAENEYKRKNITNLVIFKIINFDSFKNLHTLNFGHDFDQEIKENVLPANLHTLIFGIYFNQEIGVNVLPSKLHTLTFGREFNQEIKENVLPHSLHTLTFGLDFNQEIKENVLPGNLHTLTLGWAFNQEIKESVLPGNLHTLTFGKNFNQEIGVNVLPNNLHTITFGEMFNQEIKLCVLPSNLCTITFGVKFNQEIKENVLPSKLQTLTFGYYFDQEIKKNVLPNNLHTLTFDTLFYQEIKPHVLPSNLHTITFSPDFDQIIEKNLLPVKLHTLTFGYEFNQKIKENVLPDNLHTLTFGEMFNQEIGVNVLPICLHTLTFGKNFNQAIKDDVLPNSLRVLNFDYNFNENLEKLPPSLNELKIDINSLKKILLTQTLPTLQTLTIIKNHSINVGDLPLSLKTLNFDYYNQKIDIGVLPSSLENLTFGKNFDQKIDIGVLPSSLKNLTFGRNFNQKIDIGVLPSSLQNLTFGMLYNQKIDIGVLPSSIQNINISRSYIGTIPCDSDKITWLY